MFSWPAVFIHTLVDSSASACRVHWHHAIIGCVQCNSWVTTHDLQLLSSNGISLECPWAPVQAAHLSRDFSGSLRLTIFHDILLIHRKTHMLTPINSSIAHFHFCWGSVLLQAASSRLEGFNLTHALWSRLWDSAGDKHPAREYQPPSLQRASRYTGLF